MYVLILIVTVIASAGICHLVARKHGVNPVFWGCMGIVFGPLAIPFVLLAKPSTD